jgi:hypothetical protein
MKGRRSFGNCMNVVPDPGFSAAGRIKRKTGEET